MIKNLLQEGFALKNKGHYKHAIEVFYKALEEDNTSAELMLEIADIYYLMGNEERALNYIEQVIDKDPAHIEALKLLKKIFLNKNAYAEAEQTAKNIYCVTRNNDDLAEIFRLLNIQHKYDEIFEYQIENPNSTVYFEQARALFYKKDFVSAGKIVDKALELEPNNQEMLLLLGKIHYAQNNKEFCVSLIGKFDKDCKNAELLNFLGLVEAYRENYKQSINYFMQAISIERQNADYYYNLGNVYFKQGEEVLAKKNYNLALSLNPENNNYHFALANLYYKEKHYKRALEELNGDFFEAKLLKAVILYDTGYLALAKKELSILAQDQPDNCILQEYQSRIEQELRFN